MSSASVTTSQQVPAYFLQEASELLQQIDNELQTLRQDFNIQKMHRLMRSAHTLKGAAASVGLDAIKKTTHSLEDTFKALCTPDTTLTPIVERLIFEAYDCLRLLLSAQLSDAQIDESAVLDRMANVVVKLQENLGEQFGQGGYLPTSSELGFDMTQAIFEMGVAQRLEALESALKTPETADLKSLLQSQAEVFFGLAESLNLPGLGDIAQTTLTALEKQPDQIFQIATVVLEDYRAAQTAVLQGDRSQGGAPSEALKILAQQPSSKGRQRDPLSKQLQDQESRLSKPNWLKRAWLQLKQQFNHPKVAEEASRQISETDTEDFESLVPVETFDEGINSDISAATQALELSPIPEDDLLLVESNSIGIEQVQNLLDQSIKDSSVLPSNVLSQEASNSTQSIESSKKSTTLRVSVDHLEQLNHIIGALLTQQSRQILCNEQLTVATKTLLNHLGQQQKKLNTLQRQTVQSSANFYLAEPQSPEHLFDTLELDNYSQQQLLVQSSLDTVVQQRENAEAIELFLRQSHQTLEKQQRLVDDLRETMLDVRMQPLGNLFERFHQVLARLSTQHDKSVDLQIQGDTVLADKVIVDKLYEPLLHLVRNAFDHGIESLEIRQQQNKLDRGQIKISAFQSGHNLVIKVQDNGKGLDLEAIAQKALDNQLVTLAELQQLTPSQISNFIFEPELSTASQVNELSGRGVGLDIVQAQINSLGGKVTVTHQPEKGTCFTLKVPANLTISKLLLCQAGTQLYALMTDTIQQIIIPTANQLKTWDNRKILSLELNGKIQDIIVVPIVEALPYNNLLPNSNESDTHKISDANPVILIQYRNRLIGLEVNQLIGEKELVLQSLGSFVTTPSYVCGCSLLPDGGLSLVVDPTPLAFKLLKSFSQGSGSKAKVQSKPPLPANSQVVTTSRSSILIVDDSITVRNTLAQSLEKAGYQVLQAKEGNEALQKLAQARVSAILCDLEMPGMNGFEFLKVRQKKPEIASIPTIMLTSRTGVKHRQLAHQLGATDYVTKPYLSPQLLTVLTNTLQKS
ncbi:MAG: hybrid sensor histidine kinase/response regulator [Cyanobacteria bacterium P01_D01_bin.56]